MNEDSGEVNVLEFIMYRRCLVAEYTNTAQEEVIKLPYDYFLLNFKLAYIKDKMKTEEGREYLRKAYRLQQTKPDMKKIKELKGYRQE